MDDGSFCQAWRLAVQFVHIKCQTWRPGILIAWGMICLFPGHEIDDACGQQSNQLYLRDRLR